MRRITLWRVFLLLAMAGTLCFIFSRSLRSPGESENESERVKKILMLLLNGEETALGRFVSRYVRKIAHFTEFFLLGTEATLFSFSTHRKKLLLYQLGFGLCVAAADETIQRFTGRGASVRDVILDFSGFLTATAFLCLIGWSVARYRRIRRAKKKG